MIETQTLGEDVRPRLVRAARLTLTVEKGEFVFLTGPSGAGKSTLLRLLLLQERPTEGDVIVAGRNLAQADAATRSRPTAGRSASSSRTSS